MGSGFWSGGGLSGMALLARLRQRAGSRIGTRIAWIRAITTATLEEHVHPVFEYASFATERCDGFLLNEQDLSPEL
jgi:hypothetical protein